MADKNEMYLLKLSGDRREDCTAQVNYAKALMNDGVEVKNICVHNRFKSRNANTRGFVSFSCRDDFFTQTSRENLKYIDISEDVRYGKKSVFLFPGHGIYQKNMIGLLSEVNDFFLVRFMELDRICMKLCQKSLFDAADESNTVRWLRMFSSELVMAQFWEQCGVYADYVIGHSFGEYAAACFSGIMDEESAVEMIVNRCRILDIDSAYSMAAAETDAEIICSEAEEMKIKIYISGYNAPDVTLITAEKTDMLSLAEHCRKKKITLNVINHKTGGHFSLLSGQAEKYCSEIENLTFHSPKRKIISTVYPDDESIAFDSTYWKEHICMPVKFCQAVKKLNENEIGRFIDVGVSPVLLGLARRIIKSADICFIPSVRAGRNYLAQIYRAIGLAYMSGADISLSNEFGEKII